MINPSNPSLLKNPPNPWGKIHGAVTLIHSYNIPLYILISYLTEYKL
jgi:hypothetical protein